MKHALSGLRKAVRMLRPWEPRAERQQAIAIAAAEKGRSQAKAAQAKVIEQQIRRIVMENNWAAAVADSLGIHREEK